MMGRLSGGQKQLFYSFNLDDHVPSDHLLRGIDQFLDLGDLHRHLAPYYSHTGRPSIDPQLLIRMLIVKPKLLIVDELGYLPLEANAAHLFFQVVSRRYERGSVLVTSNRAVSEWGAVFGDSIVATAILDRLLHHSHVITIRGDSYRLSGSHRTLAREGWPDFVFAFHDGDKIGPKMPSRIAKHTGLNPSDL
jgi:hypothetical protein